MSEAATAQAPAGSSLEAIAQTLERFVTATTEALAAAAVPAETHKTVAATGDDLVQMVTDHADRVSELESEVQALEAELTAERETRAKEAAEDRKRIHEVEQTVGAAIEADEVGASAETNSRGDTEPTDDVQPPETPLEDVIRVPEHLVEESLTANQRRARFVATDVHEYTRSVPAGRAIRSSQLRQVLSASEDTQIYTETVSRVIQFLDELGGDAVTVQESRRGERVVVFDDAFVDRVQAYHHARTKSNTVVTEHGVRG